MSLESLRCRLWEYDRLYRIGEPAISDTEYDRQLQELQRLEKQSGKPIPPDSPTQRIGGEPIEGLQTVKHSVPMLSIENTYSIGELQEFGKRVQKTADGNTKTADGRRQTAEEVSRRQTADGSRVGDFVAKELSKDLDSTLASAAVCRLPSAVSISWVVELKVDGVAASLIYENGILVQGLTRGNGIQGDDITHNIKTLRDIPLRLSLPNPPKRLEVRGEIYMRNSDLAELLNKEIIKVKRDETGKPMPVNTRNVAAGAIRLLDPKICAERKLRFFAHSVGTTDDLPVKTHWDFLRQLESLGIPVAPHSRLFATFAEAAEYCEALYAGDNNVSAEKGLNNIPSSAERGLNNVPSPLGGRDRVGAEHGHASSPHPNPPPKGGGDSYNFLADLDFEIDGLVLKVNDFALREQIGTTGHHPRWVIAYKVEKYEAETVLKEIRVQVGKAGTITPVAELEPVELAGTTVSRASLHNAEEIERKDIRVGDTVVVEKAGKIIPHIVRVEKHLRTRPIEPFRFPSACPECGSALSKDEGGVYIRCNNARCPAQFKEKLRYFAGRNAMDIEGLGEKLIEQLADTKLVQSFADLYRLQAEDVKKLERMGSKSAQKLIDAIAKSKEKELSRFLHALSIRHVGNRTASLLAKHFGSLDRLRQASEEEIGAVDEVGPVIAKSVADFFRNEKTMLDDLLSAMGETAMQQNAMKQNTMKQNEEVKSNESGLPLKGMTIVVTGTLEHFKRTEIESVIERFGGRASGSVSSKTSFVLTGSEPGSKLSKAQKLGIRIVHEPEFLAMIGE